MSLEILRMLERMIVAVGGIASIVLGYRLFAVISLGNISGGQFKSQLFSITMTKIGPGVFFALFGAYILVSDLNSQIHQETENNDGGVNIALGQLVDVIKSLPESPEKMKALRLANEALEVPPYRKRVLTEGMMPR